MFKHSGYVFVLLMFFSLPGVASVGSLLLVMGEVTIERADQKLVAKTGDVLQAQDKIKTMAASRAQLRFSDDTVITLGANTDFAINAFLNETSSQSQAKFSVTQGTFKAITGRIGKVAPDNFKLETRTATIGIRGTIFSGYIGENREAIATLNGLIRVTHNRSGAFVDVPAGQVTQLVLGADPDAPRPLTLDDIDLLNTDLQTQDSSAVFDVPVASIYLQDEINRTIGYVNQQVVQVLDNELAAQSESVVEQQVLQNDVTALAAWVIALDPDTEGVVPLDNNITSSRLIGSFTDYIGWGSWEADTGLTGLWAGGSLDMANAATRHIDSLVTPATADYTYNGQVMGRVYDAVGSYAIDSASSNVQFVFDFNQTGAAQLQSGHINFSAGTGGVWALTATATSVASGQFVFDLAGGSATGSGGGSFYGSNADAVAGAFNAVDADKTALGVFKAVR